MSYCYDTNTDYNSYIQSYLDHISHVSYILFVSFFIFFNGTLLSSIIISRSIYNPRLDLDYSDEDDEDDDEDEDDDTIKYEYKYVDEFETMIENMNKRLENQTNTDMDIVDDVVDDGENKETKMNEIIQPDNHVENKINLLNLIIMETTPNGNVVMSYEYDKDVPERSKFIYYANDKSIPYKYLDTVARKYVYVYKCPEIYVYIKDELIKEQKKIEDEKKQEEDMKKLNQEKKNSVFASFKKYKNPLTEKRKRNILVTKNKYKYLGTIDDYNKTLLPKEDQKEIKQISFSDFKLMNQPS